MENCIFLSSDAVTNASRWYEQHCGIKPTHEDFEKYFHCKISGIMLQFNNKRDYTYFILRWGQ